MIQVPKMTKWASYVNHANSIRKAIIENLDELLNANAELNGRVKKLLEEKNDLEKRLGEKEREADGLRETLKLNEDEIRGIKLKAEGLQKRLGELENGLSKVQDLEKRLREKKSEVDGLRKALKLKEDETQSLIASKFLQFEDIRLNSSASYLQEAEELKKRVRELEKRLGEKKSEVEGLREAFKLKEDEIQSIQLKGEELKIEERRSRATESEERPSRVTELRRTPWRVKCDKCGALRPLEFTVDEVKKLMSDEYLTVECGNPDCTNQAGRHNIKVQLNTLI